MEDRIQKPDPDQKNEEFEAIPEHITKSLNFETGLLEHPRFIKAYEHVENTRLRNLAVLRKKIIPRPKKRSLLVVGAPNSGKTTFLEYCLQRGEERARELKRENRTLLVKLKGNPSYYDFAAMLLQAVTNATAKKPNYLWTEETITDTIVTGLKNLQTEVILVDEAHHLTINKNSDARKEIILLLKSLIDSVDPIFVFAGTNELKKLYKNDEVESRVAVPIVDLNYDWNDERDNFAAQVQYFINKTNLKTKLDFENKDDWTARLYFTTGGRIGNLIKFLSKTVEVASERSEPKAEVNLTAALLARVFDLFHSTIDQKPVISVLIFAES